MTALGKLHTLSMLDCHNLTNEGVDQIAHMPALQTVILDECVRVTDHGKPT